MRIPFACAFKELLASYDKANYASYLLNFFPVRYKACRGMWKFSQLSTKNFLEKITQNKVCICQKLCMYGSEFFLTMGLVFRKARCLPNSLKLTRLKNMKQEDLSSICRRIPNQKA